MTGNGPIRPYRKIAVMKIEKFGGTSPQLYSLVAPLVMDPVVLRQNNNYPFKTSARHEWLVAFDDEGTTVEGFFPVERRDTYLYVNNYYVSEKHEKTVLKEFVQEVKHLCEKNIPLILVSHTRHADFFYQKGFSIEKEWKLYVKMKYVKAERKTQERV